MRKLLWVDQWRQDLDCIDPRVAQLRWLAIKCRFIQRLPSLTGIGLAYLGCGLLERIGQLLDDRAEN